MIHVEQVYKEYEKILAVRGASFGIGAGDLVGLVGPNGAGKSTLMKCMVGILQPSSGRVLVGGHDIVEDPIAAKRQLAFVPETPSLYEDLTVWEHVQFSGRLYRAEGIDERGDGLLRRFDLTEKKHAIISSLSKGMKQKTALCCALVHEPKALLLDEPLIGLDPKAGRSIRDILKDIAAAGTAVMVSSHQLDMVERLCSRVIIIRRGEILLDGSLQDVEARAGLGGGATLEDMFLHLTGDEAESHAPVPGEGPADA